MRIPINWVLRKHGCIYQPTGKTYLLPKKAIFCHFLAKNGHFQDIKSINQLVLEQFYRISTLQISVYSCMGLHASIPKQIMLGPKMPFFDHFQSKKAYFRGFWGLVCGLCIFCIQIIISSIHI